MNDKIVARPISTIPTIYLTHADQWFDTGASGGGHFLNALYDCCSHADLNNLNKLNNAFPIEVGAWLHRQRGKKAMTDAMGLTA